MIKKIRNKFSPKLLCKDFPKKFINQFERLLELPQNDVPNYTEIINSFREMKQEYINFFGEKKYKFEWIDKLEYFANGDNIFLNETSIFYIKEFISKYGLNLEEYLNFLKN